MAVHQFEMLKGLEFPRQRREKEDSENTLRTPALRLPPWMQGCQAVGGWVG